MKAVGTLRAVARDVVIYGAGDMVLRAAAFLTLPIYTRVLHPSDYGVLSFLWAMQALLVSILGLGGDSAYARYFFEAKTDEQRRLVTSTWMTFLAVWSVVAMILAVPFSGIFARLTLDSGGHGLAFALALVGAPVTLMSAMLGQILRNQFRARLYAVLNVSATLLATGLALVFLLAFDWGVEGVVGGTVLGFVVFIPFRTWIARDLLEWRFSRPLLRDLLAFGLPLVPASLAWWIFELSDRVVLARMSTLREVGFYSVAVSLTSVLALVNSSFGQAWSPHAVSVYENEVERAPAFFGRVLTYLLVGFGALAVAVSAFAYDIVRLVSGAGFAGATDAVAPLALGFVAYASVQVTAIGISLKKKTKYLAILAWVAAVVNVILNVAFVPVWGMLASAWATFASYALLTAGFVIVSQRLWRVEYETRKSLTVALVTFAIALATVIVPLPAGLAMRLAVGVGWCLAYAVLLVVFQVLDAREWSGVLQLLRDRRVQQPREAV